MSEVHRLKLLERLQSAPLNDIPAKLRQLADRLESGAVEAESCVVVMPDQLSGELLVMGFGDAEPLYGHWLLCLAQRQIEGA